jgi:hypothetical protein
MGAIMWRAAKSFFVHLFMLLLALLLIYFIVQGQDSLSSNVRDTLKTARSLATRLDDARGELMMWCFVGFLISWLASSLFLASAERAAPANEAEARCRLGLWSFLLILVIAMLGANYWLSLLGAQVNVTLASNTFMAAVLIGGLAVVVAYYFATGLIVKRVMRPSVPLAAGLPTFWS